MLRSCTQSHKYFCTQAAGGVACALEKRHSQLSSPSCLVFDRVVGTSDRLGEGSAFEQNCSFEQIAGEFCCFEHFHFSGLLFMNASCLSPLLHPLSFARRRGLIHVQHLWCKRVSRNACERFSSSLILKISNVLFSQVLFSYLLPRGGALQCW